VAVVVVVVAVAVAVVAVVVVVVVVVVAVVVAVVVVVVVVVVAVVVVEVVVVVAVVVVIYVRFYCFILFIDLTLYTVLYIAMTLDNVVQGRPFNYCVVDEADSILIDEARTPLIISRKGNSIIYIYSLIYMCVYS